jgi:TatA/E family protein of Tat protein translocase
MGPLGWQETVFIFVLALLLFGPKKLPELGKTLGKAITEFKRASSELKATFDREMSSLERENESIKEVTSSYSPDSYKYDYNYNYDSPEYDWDGSKSLESQSPASNDSNATATSTVGASAPQGAESHSGTAPEGTVETAVGTAPHDGAAPGHSEAPAEPAPVKPSDGTQSAAS